MNTALVNPFDFNCSVGPETVGQSSAGPCFPDPMVPAGGLSACISQGEGQPACDRAAGLSGAPVQERPLTILASAAPLPAQAERADTAGIVGPSPMPAAFPADTQLITEHFSDHAHRRSMPFISPPLNAERIGLNAVRAALNIHPRDLDLDPPPLFLRKPRPAFLRALLELGSPR